MNRGLALDALLKIPKGFNINSPGYQFGVNRGINQLFNPCGVDFKMIFCAFFRSPGYNPGLLIFKPFGFLTKLVFTSPYPMLP
jgi:hypothetical protein